MQTLGWSSSANWVASDRGTMTVGDGNQFRLRHATLACTFGTNFCGVMPNMGAFHFTLGGSYQASPMYFNLTSPRVLTRFEGLGTSASTPAWATTNWVLNVWEAIPGQAVEDVFAASPVAGNVISNLAVAESHTALTGGKFQVVLTPAAGVALPQGNYLLSVSAKNTVFGTAWFWKEVEAPAGYPSDIYATNGLAGWQTYSPQLGYATGAQAVDIWGY